MVSQTVVSGFKGKKDKESRRMAKDKIGGGSTETYKVPSKKMELMVSFRFVASWSFQSEGSSRARIPTSMRTFKMLVATK